MKKNLPRVNQLLVSAFASISLTTLLFTLQTAYFTPKKAHAQNGQVLGQKTLLAKLYLKGSGDTGQISYTTTDIGFDSDGDGTADMIILNNGLVGIGTTAPASKLSINGAGLSSNLVSIQGDQGTGAHGTRPRHIGFMGATNSNVRAEIGLDTSLKDLVINALEEGASWRNILLAESGGNVGIGTTTVNDKLVVDTGTSALKAKFTIDSLSLNDAGTPGELPYIEWRESDGGTRAMYLGWGSTSSKYVNMALENSYVLGISGGNVGIGKTDPTTALDVNGTVTATDLTCSNCLNQGDIASAAVGRGELKTADSSQAFSSTTNVTMHTYTFFPNTDWGGCVGGSQQYMMMSNYNTTNDTVGRYLQYLATSCSSGNVAVRWRYVASSDYPTIWVQANADGSLVNVWEAEDPVEYPSNPNPFEGTPLEEGQRFVSVEPLTIEQSESLYNALPFEDKSQILLSLREYIVDKRSWLEAFESLADISQISDRYRPAARFWAMKFVANYYEIAPAELIFKMMIVDNDKLELKPNVYEVLLAHLEQRRQNFEKKALEAQKLANLPKNQRNSDLAEWYTPQEGTVIPEATDIISVGLQGFIVKSSQSYDSNVMGIISTSPGKILSEKSGEADVKVSLSGRVPVKISSINGNIQPGDPVTSSEIPGTGMKATKTGPIVGKALGNFDGSQGEPCPEKPEYMCGKILVFLNLSWFDPDVYLTDIGDLTISNSIVDGLTKYELKDKNDNLITRVGAFAEIASAKIKAGLIETKKLTVNDIDILEKLNQLSEKVEVQQKEIGELKKEIEELKKR